MYRKSSAMLFECINMLSSMAGMKEQKSITLKEHMMRLEMARLKAENDVLRTRSTTVNNYMFSQSVDTVAGVIKGDDNGRK